MSAVFSGLAEPGTLSNPAQVAYRLRTKLILASITVVMPSDVCSIVVDMAAGGQGGQGGYAGLNGGGGGGGGAGDAMVGATMPVTPGETLTCTVGAGGLGLNPGEALTASISGLSRISGSLRFLECNNAGQGNTQTLPTLTNGGQGGTVSYGAAQPAAVGSGVTGATGTQIVTSANYMHNIVAASGRVTNGGGGGGGGNPGGGGGVSLSAKSWLYSAAGGAGNSSGGGGGGGGSNMFSQGGAGGAGGAAANDATGYGGGGGGGGSNAKGGNGAPGFIRIYYWSATEIA